MSTPIATGADRRAEGSWRPASTSAVACFVVSAVLAFGGSFAIRYIPEMPAWARMVIALLPLPALAGIVVFGLRAIARMDELERRVQAEALAVAFGVLSALLVTYGQLHAAGFLGPERWTLLWPLMWATYCAGWAWAARRYR